MAMSMQGQELFISAMAKIVVDVAVQNNPEYNKFMDGIISSLITMAKVEKLLDDDEINIAVSIINNRAKEILQIVDMGNEERQSDIDDIINNALNSNN
jgi:hypothetical protein